MEMLMEIHELLWPILCKKKVYILLEVFLRILGAITTIIEPSIFTKYQPMGKPEHSFAQEQYSFP